MKPKSAQQCFSLCSTQSAVLSHGCGKLSSLFGACQHASFVLKCLPSHYTSSHQRNKHRAEKVGSKRRSLCKVFCVLQPKVQASLVKCFLSSAQAAGRAKSVVAIGTLNAQQRPIKVQHCKVHTRTPMHANAQAHVQTPYSTNKHTKR